MKRSRIISPVICCTLMLSAAGACHRQPRTAETEPHKPRERAQITQVQPPLTTIEQCANAWDDNENGLIDEGCGVKQAQIQVLVAWDDDDLDLDLLVSDPKGEVATPNAPTASGLAVLRDCPSEDTCDSKPYEMVYLEEDEYLAGRYRVRVLVQKLPETGRPVIARLGIRTPEYTRAYRLAFYDSTQIIDLDFVVAALRQSE